MEATRKVITASHRAYGQEDTEACTHPPQGPLEGVAFRSQCPPDVQPNTELVALSDLDRNIDNIISSGGGGGPRSVIKAS